MKEQASRERRPAHAVGADSLNWNKRRTPPVPMTTFLSFGTPSLVPKKISSCGYEALTALRDRPKEEKHLQNASQRDFRAMAASVGDEAVKWLVLSLVER